MSKPDRIDELAGGFRQSQILLTANRLGLFDAIGKATVTADEAARRLKADPRAVRILLHALAALELLVKRDDGFCLTELAREDLLAISPASRQAILLHHARLYHTWGALYDVVRSGQPASEDVIPPELEHNPHAFARAMADVGRGEADATAAALPVDRPARILDAGGGPGLYSVAMARQYPEAQVVLIDSAPTLEVAAEAITASGLGARIESRVGDILSDNLGPDYDAILVSNVVHMFSPQQNAALVARCAGALAAGGVLCIKDFVLEPSRTEPASAAVFAINMLVNTEGGDCYTVGDMQGWFKEAGLQLHDVTPIGGRSRLVSARKG